MIKKKEVVVIENEVVEVKKEVALIEIILVKKVLVVLEIKEEMVVVVEVKKVLESNRGKCRGRGRNCVRVQGSHRMLGLRRLWGFGRLETIFRSKRKLWDIRRSRKM